MADAKWLHCITCQYIVVCDSEIIKDCSWCFQGSRFKEAFQITAGSTHVMSALAFFAPKSHETMIDYLSHISYDSIDTTLSKSSNEAFKRPYERVRHKLSCWDNVEVVEHTFLWRNSIGGNRWDLTPHVIYVYAHWNDEIRTKTYLLKIKKFGPVRYCDDYSVIEWWTRDIKL
jgi:hypothetical protein